MVISSLTDSGVIYLDGEKKIIGKSNSYSIMPWRNMFWDSIKYRILVVKLKRKSFNISIAIVYTPTTQCTEKEIEQFYRILDNAKAHYKLREVKVAIGDQNAKLGKEWDGQTVGVFKLGTRTNAVHDE